MVKSFQMAVAGAAKRLSDVYGGTAGADPDPKLDLSYRAIYLQAETGAITIGTDNTVSATVYGSSIAVAAILSLQPAQPGSPMHLSDLWAFGTGTLHILAVPL